MVFGIFEIKMAFSAEKITFLLVFGILILSNAIYANTKETIENSVGGGLFMHFIVFVAVVVTLCECSELRK